jgi:nitroreductase
MNLNNYDSLKYICQKRRSVRDFQETPVSEQDIQKILEIARTSPYASNKKNWEIIVIDNPTLIRDIAAGVKRSAETLAFEKIREDFKEGFSQYAKNFYAFQTAPVLLIPVFRASKSITYMMKSPDPLISQWERDNYVKSISCVSLLIILAGESLGLGSCYMTGPLIASPAIGQLINIKKGHQIASIIPIGYPK